METTFFCSDLPHLSHSAVSDRVLGNDSFQSLRFLPILAGDIHIIVLQHQPQWLLH